MKEETPLRKILKRRKMTLRELYFSIYTEIKLTRLSDIKAGRITPTNQEIQILDRYLKLTEDEIEELEGKLNATYSLYGASDYEFIKLEAKIQILQKLLGE